MILASDRAVCEVAFRGGLASLELVEDALATRIGLLAAERGVRLALVAGRLEPVTMLDGAPGLRLVRAER